MKLHIATFFTMTCFAFTICESRVATFQQILKTRQQDGRLLKNETMKLSKRRVFTKMECLDVCLRNPLCGSFQMKLKVSDDTTYEWICQIVRQRVNSTEATPPRRVGSNRWIHFNVSSYELQEVSSLGRAFGTGSSLFDQAFG